MRDHVLASKSPSGLIGGRLRIGSAGTIGSVVAGHDRSVRALVGDASVLRVYGVKVVMKVTVPSSCPLYRSSQEKRLPIDHESRLWIEDMSAGPK